MNYHLPLIGVILFHLALSAQAQESAGSRKILAYDDFSGSAGPLDARVLPGGDFAWNSPQDENGLQMDGDGAAVLHPDARDDASRKYAWIDVSAQAKQGQEFYVAGRFNLDGTGWGAVGFGANQSNAEPLLGSTTFAVNSVGGYFIWVRGTSQFHQGILPAAAAFSKGRPSELGVLYNRETGLMKYFFNNMEVHELTCPNLKVERANLAFHLDTSDDKALSVTDFVVADRQVTEIPDHAEK